MNEEKTGDLVPKDVSTKSVLQIVFEEADQRIEVMNRLFEKSVKVTKKYDWMLQGTGNRAKPYLKSDAACQLADFFMFEYFDLEFLPMERIKHKEGPDELLFTVTGKCKIPGLGIQPVMGSSSTRDDLYSKRTKDGKSYYLELHDISIPKVRNKSLTNFLGNGPRHRLNLINIPVAEFERLTGYKIGELTESVDYQGSRGTKKELSAEDQKKVDEMRAWGDFITQGDAAKQGDIIFKMTHSPDKGFDGIRRYEQLTPGRIKWMHPEFKKLYEKAVDAEANPGGKK